jgi:ribosomal protein S18 acetylase RimI-like enzyme
MALENITLKTYDHGFDIYRESVKLRTKILLEPLGRPETVSDYDLPDKDIYLGAFLGENLIATLVLTPLEDGRMRMRQLAVDANFRNKGVGKALVQKAEELAKERGFSRMTLHARESALDFYDRLGYRRQGERFIEVDLPHWTMDKVLS